MEVSLVAGNHCGSTCDGICLTVDPNEFEDPAGLKDVADSNKDYVFMFRYIII